MIYFDSFVPKHQHAHLDTVARFVEMELVSPELPMHEQWEGVKAGFDMLDLVTGLFNVRMLLNTLFTHERYFAARFGKEAFNWVITDLVRAERLIEETLKDTHHFAMEQ